MPEIFISYRRSDSQDVTGRIYDRLVAAWPHGIVFKDVDNIPIGTNFLTYLQDTVVSSKVVLVIIGRAWLTAVDEKGQRKLNLQDDHVRREIFLALSTGKTVIPVTVSNATMPTTSELPADIVECVFRNGHPVRPDPDFHHDVDRLISHVAQVICRAPASRLPDKRHRPRYLTKYLVCFMLSQAWVGWYVGQRPEWVKLLFWKGGFISDIAYAIPGAVDGGLQGGIIWSVALLLFVTFLYSIVWFLNGVSDRGE